MYPFVMRLVAAALIGTVVGARAADGGERDATLSGGSFTIPRSDSAAYSEPAPVLSAKQRQMFAVGRNVFNRKWAAVVSLNGDWGLGPTFIGSQCSECHVRAGRGGPPPPGQQLLSMLVRISIPGEEPHGEPRPDRHYGDQFQNRSLRGQSIDLAYSIEPVPAEAELFLDWQEETITFADGEAVTLRRPLLRIEKLAFGDLAPGAMTSLRMAPPIFGLGLLDAVSEPTILALADRQRALGLNGRVNRVWDLTQQRTVLGRYGWKANQATLQQQIAAAALGDMGLSSRLFPDQNCPAVQQICRRELPGNVPEIINHELDALELWLRGMAVPARRNVADPRVRHGEELFLAAQCGACHVPELTTGASFPSFPQLANQIFSPYTDLLLHDMGDGLADGRPDFLAGPRDWRTPALWGNGLSETVNGSRAMLHDGRARNATEAILWHGGEAQPSRERFRAMSKADREALLRFLDSI